MNAFVKTGKIFSLAILTLLLAWPTSGTAEEAGALSAAPVFELPPARGAADLSGLEALSSPRDDASQLGGGQGPSVQSGSGSAVVDMALGLFGLPGMSRAADDDGSAYEKARRMRDGPGGSTRLTYGERYRRNPDGSYGTQSSSRWSGAGVADRMLEQALSAGSGWFSSWAEGWLGGYGKARIQLRINDEGEVTGAGDFLLPLYDSEYTAVFTQLGLRTMAGDRVIGNFGLGQRFFPAENFAFGYNAFIDQDFSRNHTRGGLGLEAWYDWLRLSANYYTPLSGWKGSKDYDSRLVEERPAEGYDARLTGYLPFYRNLAVTGAFEQWKGDRVGSFGSNDVVRKDPKVWSYGLEWTPVPAFSASVNQRHSGSQKETQFGLTFNYLFGMDWEDQLSPAMVTEMRTVDGSRHDFVNRQNEIILEYRAKEGAYNIIQRGSGGANIFLFQITNGFGEPVAGQRVAVSLPAGVVDSGGGAYTTDADGYIRLALTTVPAGTPLPIMATLTAGKTSRTFPLAGASVSGGLLNFTTTGESSNFNSIGAGYQSTIEVTLTQYDDGSGPKALPSGASVVWDVKSVSNPSEPWWKRNPTAKNGLTWGPTADGTSLWADDKVEGTAPITGTIKLTDVVGSRSVTLEASVCIGGNGNETAAAACTSNGGAWYTDEKTVTFGAGPLSVFTTDPRSGVGVQWATAAGAKDNSGLTKLDTTATRGDFTADDTGFPAIAAVGGNSPNITGFTYGGSGPSSWTATFPMSGWTSAGRAGAYYADGSSLPTVEQLVAVARYDDYYNTGVPRKGAAFAADWPADGGGSGWYIYWSGEVMFGPTGHFGARGVSLYNGGDNFVDVDDNLPVAVGAHP